VGLAIGKIQPEPTASDVSLLVIEAEHNVSHNRLQTVLTTAKLEAQWLSIATLTPANRHHLVEFKGFILPSDEKLQSSLAPLGSAIKQVNFLGAYATPFTLESESTVKHAARAK
jgi:hypothetical protein